jgi:hypothetical protein
MQLSLQFRDDILQKTKHMDIYWGLFALELNLPQGQDYDQLTLADCASREFNAIERVLTRALGRHGGGAW